MGNIATTCWRGLMPPAISSTALCKALSPACWGLVPLRDPCRVKSLTHGQFGILPELDLRTWNASALRHGTVVKRPLGWISKNAILNGSM
jgi:hypothetical protein